MKKIAALQTARAGSKSVPKKNLLKVNGHPLFAHSILSANQVVLDVYCSTDDPEIKELADYYHFKVIDRPKHLCPDDASHLEVMRHGIIEMEKDLGKLDLVIILLGNVVGASPDEIGEALDNMGDEDSICSVSASNMFNPYRAHHIKNGYLETVIPQEMIPNRDTINNKNDQGDIYFRNGNFDIVKRDVFFRDDNNLPLQWLGKKIKPYIQDMTWELDEPWQESYIHETSRYK
tara:strand:- start:83 stop:781 length:699 start_codon:yes stop_codon:yes gene_type:complete